MIKEKFVAWLAWKLPSYLVYWCAIRVVTHATVDEYRDTVLSELSAMDALARWE